MCTSRSSWRTNSFAAAWLLCCAAAFSQPVSSRSTPPAPFSTEVERCIVPASEFHTVNYHLLRAILRVESGLRAQVVSRNSNGSVDVGIGQINSLHFSELAKHGIAPESLLDACVATYVSAWYLRKTILTHGNTWEGVARYHSSTPQFNRRYQVLLKNELIKAGVLSGAVQPVPALAQRGGQQVASAGAGRGSTSGPSLVSDIAR